MFALLTAAPAADPARPLTSRFLPFLLLMLTAACGDTYMFMPEAEDPKPEGGPQLTFGTSGEDVATAAVAHASGVYVAGHTAGSLDGPNQGATDVFVRKYHPTGELLWTTQFGSHLSDKPTAVAADASGSLYVVGTTNGSIAGSRGSFDIFVRRYNPNGVVLWTRQFGTASIDEAASVAVAGDGSVYVGGNTQGAMQGNHKGSVDAVLIKLAPNGNELWIRQFGTSFSDAVGGVGVDGSGNIYIVGATVGVLQGSTNAGQEDAFIRKYDPTGVVLWTKQFGTAAEDVAMRVAVDGAGSAIIAGHTLGTLQGAGVSGPSDAFIRKYDAAGGVVVTRQFGSSAGEVAMGIAVDASDSYYVSGVTGGDLGGAHAGGIADVFVRKYNSSNQVQWTKQFGTSGFDVGNAVAARVSSAIFVAGSTTGTLVGQNRGAEDAFLRRLDANGNAVWTDQ